MVPAPHTQPCPGAAGDRGGQREQLGAADRPLRGVSLNTTLNTTLKWSEEGELSALDLDRIVARLADADPVASHLSLHHFGMAGREGVNGCRSDAGHHAG
ncbi:hypothetical protein [Cyanobium sp. NIES-981]|uniref:hypothetical protein n=1 Tax=Cyanobium sp. NIES-981 TaxID=1851505 RepID=UPI0007DD3316|nr:hypothetical protein [Cyanobium sp. NIES-981]SBO42503.1 conserved protein of unknown function [Cyanobium sp. NIES-981]